MTDSAVHQIAKRAKPARMVVHRAAASPRLLLCATEKFPRLVLVRVADNANFVSGMKIEAKLAGDRLWDFHRRAGGDDAAAERLPRQLGEW